MTVILDVTELRARLIAAIEKEDSQRRSAELWRDRYTTYCRLYHEVSKERDQLKSENLALRAEMRVLEKNVSNHPTLRPEVARFAELMERKLRENDHKTHWHHGANSYLRRRLRTELGELMAEMDSATREFGSDATAKAGRPLLSVGTLPRERALAIAREAVDVANFCMMIADNCGGLDE